MLLSPRVTNLDMLIVLFNALGGFGNLQVETNFFEGIGKRLSTASVSLYGRHPLVFFANCDSTVNGCFRVVN